MSLRDVSTFEVLTQRPSYQNLKQIYYIYSLMKKLIIIIDNNASTSVCVFTKSEKEHTMH
jgi:hypothetical protein